MAITLSGESRRIVERLRAQGGSGLLAEFGAVRAAHTLADVLGELARLDLVEVLDARGEPVNIGGVASMLRSARRTVAADFTVRLLSAGEDVVMRVAPGAAA